MKNFTMKTGANGISSDVISISDTVDTRILGVATAETHTIPAGATMVLFSSTGDFWVDFHGATAAIPAADVTDGSSPELNPVARAVTAGGTFSMISAAAQAVSMSFYK